MSFCERSESNFIDITFSLDNYKKLFSPMYLSVFVKTFSIASLVTIVSLLLSYPFVYILSQTIHNKRIKDFLLVLVIIPFWTSSLIRTYAMIIILRIHGLINSMLFALGLTDKPIDFLYQPFAISIGFIYSLLPFMILPLYVVFEKLDRNYIDAAQDLGASKAMVLFKIIIPLTRSGITSGCILVFLSTFGMFFIPELLGGSKGILLGNLIQNKFLVARDWPFGAAISTVLIVLIVALMIIYARMHRDSDRVII